VSLFGVPCFLPDPGVFGPAFGVCHRWISNCLAALLMQKNGCAASGERGQ
jgi:hypothetical protein